MKKKLIACVLAIASLLPLATACADSTDTPVTGTTTAETTAATTVPTPAAPLPSDQYDSQFAEPSYRLMRQIIKDYWRTSFLRTDINNSGASVVWGFAGFMEAVAEAYRLYPEDKTIEKAYRNALTKGITQYKVTNAKITTPDGNSHTVSYYNAGKGGSGDYYYDDDAWICIQFLNAYELLKDDQFLAEAEETLQFLWTGWDDVLGGGIYWDKTYGGKNTCANGPVAIAFLWAYQLTQKEEYLEKGRMIYDWCREKLLDGDLYIDSLGVDGGRNNWKAAYNQGTMIYAGAQLYEITGDETYLNQARATNKATISLMFTGRGNATRMNGNPIYRSWCIGWLARGFMKFYSVDPEKDTTAMDNMAVVLKRTLKTQNKKGYYDPYFCTGDWGGESTTDVLQPCGVASVLLLTTYFQEFMEGKSE
ncbi:MAG: hypothetical protein IJW62_00920 [Clostridia bacterium]|nr:hypothetical protein [Clostridia bacterium]